MKRIDKKAIQLTLSTAVLRPLDSVQLTQVNGGGNTLLCNSEAVCYRK